MIIINSKNTADTNIFDVEKQILELQLKSQENLKNIILNYMIVFTDSKTEIEVSASESVIKFLEELKSSLNLCNQNISDMKSLLKDFEKLTETLNNDSSNLETQLDNYNDKYILTIKSISQNTLVIETCINSVSQKSEANFSVNSDQSTDNSTQNTNTEIQNTKNEKDISKNQKINNSKIQEIFSVINNQPDKYKEKRLVISESQKTVTLPYTIQDLKDKFLNEPKQYNSIDDIIEKNYTLPLSYFKNSCICRFKETFKLMRTKENSSIKKSFDLGMELIFNYKLHPAIISACNSLNELDTYLDCLDANTLNKFNFFEIIFDVPPIAMK